jgi:periplasmic protein TonB
VSVVSLALCEGVVSEDYRFMTYHSRKTIPQQLSGLGFVILLHILVVYIVASGLGQHAVEVVLGPIETRVIEEQKKPTDEAPPPPPKIETPPPYVPPPEIDIAMETSTAPTTAISNVQNVVKAPPAPPPPPTADVAPRSNPKRPVSQPDYPSASQRLGEEGVVTLALYVLEDGRVGDARVEKSSGFPRLDEAAVSHAKARWKLMPGTREGKPVAMWTQMNVRFQINKK